MTVASDSHDQSTLDAVYVYVVSWLQFPNVPSYPHYPRGGGGECSEEEGGLESGSGGGWMAETSGDTTPWRMTGVALHGVVFPERGGDGTSSRDFSFIILPRITTQML